MGTHVLPSATQSSPSAGSADPRLEQELKTPVPVSAKRLAKLWQTLGR
jgi:hypothetical protein